ncbi:acetylornithine deacetylase [Fusarium heterosporum]|uniref:Acetylornithine deacetylase n=1 Tax=Fusarium heterosporum TaxID=42747 RepID=A0A8H5TCN1_FUSHE|nr:acetylornithine deacetylase [Fusarium heterosporum]
MESNSEKPSIVIKIPTPENADDENLISALTDVVNTVYTKAERDIFIPSYKRTSAAEIAQFIRNSQLAVAYLASNSTPIGCVFVKLITPDLGAFGMLALDTNYQGGGMGRQLTTFAEDECRRRGCTRMQLEILEPQTFHHEGKAILMRWYMRMGYKLVKLATAAAWAFKSSDITAPSLRNPAGTLASSPLIELHKDLVEQQSTSGSEKSVTDFLKTYLEENGFSVETQTVAEDRENIFAYYNHTRSARVLLTSHIDTVPPYWPYERRGDEIWGRGTVDAKGSVAAQIIATQELFQKGKISEGDVALLYVVGEEVGGLGMKKANDLGLSWESVIFGEPTELKLARGHKGGVGFTIRANGKAGHSGYPETGSNAIDSLVRGLFDLQTTSLPWSEEFGNSTLNIGLIEGGVAGNVIPGSAQATGGVRVASGTPDEIRDLLLRAVVASDPNLVVEFSAYGVGPVSTDYDIEGFETVILNYGTDIPSLKGDHKKYLYGPGSILDAHSDHEHLTVSDLEQAVEGYQSLIVQVLNRVAEL